MAEPAVPHTMRAVRLSAWREEPALEVRTVAVPWPGPGQVLVRVSAAPIHFDDLVFCRGQHGFRRALPTTPGFEGAGEVVAVGGGLVTRWLVGKRVAFAVGEEHDGSWAEYAVADAAHCVPLWEGLDDEQGATLLVDPVTALALLEEVRDRRHGGIVVTAPSAPVGRLLLELARRERLPAVAVARDDAELAAARRYGADAVLDARQPDLEGHLRRTTRSWKATAVLDGVGGPLTGRLLTAMPEGAEAILYGLDPGVRVEVDLAELVYRRKVLRGFSFHDRVRDAGRRGLSSYGRALQRHAAGALRRDVARRISLEEVPAALASFQRDLGEGVTLVRPHGRLVGTPEGA